MKWGLGNRDRRMKSVCLKGSHEGANHSGVPFSSCRPRALAALVVLAILAGPAFAVTPRDELLRLVPDDVGFCLVLQDLRGHTANLLASPFVAQLRQSPLGATLRDSKEVAQLGKVEGVLRTRLGIGWDELRDEVLGDVVVFAYRPGPPGKPDQEQGLVLIRAHSAQTLTDLIDRLNKVRKEEGKLEKVQEQQHNGATYYRRVERTSTGYYYLHGSILAYSGQEDMLRRAIDLDQSQRGEPALARRLRALGLERSLLALWLNPRAFDADVEAKVARGGPTGADARKQFAAYWKALDGVALSVDLERELSVSLALQGRPKDMPVAARRFLAEAARPSELWRRFPDDALLAIGTRLDAALLFDVLGSFLGNEGRQTMQGNLNRTVGAALGKDFVKEVLPALGPDWGLCVMAPPSQDKNWFPQAVLALRVAAGEPANPVDQAIASALHSFALLVVYGYNQKHPDQLIAPQVLREDGREVKYLTSKRGLPSGVQPAMTLRDGYLILASSLAVLRRFDSPTSASAEKGPVPQSIPWLRISFKDWRAYLKERREPLTHFLADKNGLGTEEVRRRLDNLLGSLQFIDRLELRQRSAEGQVVFTLAIQPAQPLKK
jgi:hypothetical protein